MERICWSFSTLIKVEMANNLAMGNFLPFELHLAMFIRVDVVGTIHNDLLTQWVNSAPILRTTSNYLWASEVLKNQSFYSQLFSSSLKKIPQIEIMA